MTFQKSDGITREATVWCDNEECGQWEQMAHCTTLKHAYAEAKLRGWKWTKARGWRCPGCLRAERHAKANHL